MRFERVRVVEEGDAERAQSSGDRPAARDTELVCASGERSSLDNLSDESQSLCQSTTCPLA